MAGTRTIMKEPRAGHTDDSNVIAVISYMYSLIQNIITLERIYFKVHAADKCSLKLIFIGNE